jgi:hypothetical protein
MLELRGVSGTRTVTLDGAEHGAWRADGDALRIEVPESPAEALVTARMR